MLATTLTSSLATASHNAALPTGTFPSKWGSNSTGDSKFSLPKDVGAGPDGSIYVAHTLSHRIQKSTPDRTSIAKLQSPDSGDARFNNTSDVAVDTSGNVYIADYTNHRIQKSISGGTFLAKWGTEGAADASQRH